MDIMEFNESKRQELIEKIRNCGDDYTILVLDVDNVIYNSNPIMQKLIGERDYRATDEARIFYAKEGSEDSKLAHVNSYKILDAILEETAYEDYDEELDEYITRRYKPIDYEEVYVSETLFPGVKERLNGILNNREDNFFVIACSHRNPVSEGIVKTKKLYEEFPGLDFVITMPFHVEIGSGEMNSKAEFVKKLLLLDDLHNCILIDDAKKNCVDFRKHNGMDIKFLPNGHKAHNEDKPSDHLSKLNELDPYMIQFCISYIEYLRKNREYYYEVNKDVEEVKVKKLKRDV